MRFCANENIPAVCVRRLREAGRDVLWIRESAPGSPDSDVLQRAEEEHRILLTFDRDFGELVFRSGASASRGIVLFRIEQPSGTLVSERIIEILASRSDWEGRFTVVDDFAIRMRSLPGQ